MGLRPCNVFSLWPARIEARSMLRRMSSELESFLIRLPEKKVPGKPDAVSSKLPTRGNPKGNGPCLDPKPFNVGNNEFLKAFAAHAKDSSVQS